MYFDAGYLYNAGVGVSPCRCGDVPLLRKGAGDFRRFCAILRIFPLPPFAKGGGPAGPVDTPQYIQNETATRWNSLDKHCVK